MCKISIIGSLKMNKMNKVLANLLQSINNYDTIALVKIVDNLLRTVIFIHTTNSTEGTDA